MTGDDRAELRLWHDTYEGRLSLAVQLFAAAWAVDYLGADVDCVVELLWQRAEAYKDYLRQPGHSLAAEPNHIKERYGWHNCPTVIGHFPYDSTLTPDEVVEHCETWLPEDVVLDSNSGEPYADCDDWVAQRIDKAMNYYSSSPNCVLAGLMAQQWLEHYRRFPRVPIWC